MEKYREQSESISFKDVKAIQRLVIANSFENLNDDNISGSVVLSDGAMVRANICDKKLGIGFRARGKGIADVESANPLPQLDEVYPFVQQLLKRERRSFTVRTSSKDEWIVVRFQLEDPVSEVRRFTDGISEVRDSIF